MTNKYWNKQRKFMLLFWIVSLGVYQLLIFISLGLIFSIVDRQFNYHKLWFCLVNSYKNNLLIISIITCGLTILYLIIAFAFIHFKQKQRHYIKAAKSFEHGGAKWIINEEKNNKSDLLNLNEIYPLVNIHNKNNKPGWVIRCKNVNHKTIFNIRSNTQALCLGATGSGKTQKTIIPSAIYNASLLLAQKPCMVFTDPKGELYEILAAQMQNQGYEILTLNLREPKFSNGWNPLAMTYKYYYDAISYEKNNLLVIKGLKLEEIKTKLVNFKCYIHQTLNCQTCYQLLKDNLKIYLLEQKFWLTDSKYVNQLVKAAILELKAAAYEEVEDLISTLFPIPKTDNPMWTQNAGRMVAAVIYALLEMLDYEPTALPLAKFNLTTVAVLLANQEALVQWFLQLPRNSKAFITAAPVVNTAEVTRQGAFSNIGPALKIFEDLGIQNITCRNDIDLFTISEKPKALFLIVPDEKTNRHILASVFVSQLYKASVFVANKTNGKLTRQLQFYLDEFGNMPTIPNFSSFITVARSRNMFFLLVLQDYKQLYEKYGDYDGKTIRANCNLNIYIQTNDHDTADAYSKMIGDYTVISKSISTKEKQEANNENTSQTGIPLIKSADLMRLKDPYGIVMYAKENPAKIYMEYAYKCSNMINNHLEPIKQTINVIDFYKNHYFNLLDYNFWKLMKNNDASSWTDVIKDNETKEQVKPPINIKSLQEDEIKIRDQINAYENRDYETLTTSEKRELTRLRKKLVRITNKLNNFISQPE